MKKYALLIIALTACTQAATPPQASAPLGLRASSMTAGQVNLGMLSKDTPLSHPTTLMIAHDSLGKPFLYMMGIIRSTDTAMTYDKAYKATYPRLIQFSLINNELVMEDMLVRVPFDQEFQAVHKIIAHFPIVSDDGQTITFDFTSGMRILDPWLLHNPTETLTSTVYSYIITSQSSEHSLTLDQHVQAAGSGASNQAWVVRHIFSTSLAHSTLEPRKPDETKQVGYFTTTPWYTAGDTTPHQNITRWSLDHPIRFTVSSNTPATYRDGIIQGVLDWNKAFGKEVFKYVDVPANFSPLDLDVELGIHWVQDDDYGMAYGTMLSHPQTGEILHADVIIYSGWGKGYKENYKSPTFQTDSNTTPDGFSSASVCTRDDSEMQAEMDATPELQKEDVFKRYAALAFRALVRHEVGHTLGLRHNFMGSLGAEAKDSEFDTAFQNFLDGKRVEDIPAPSSSIMDYIPFSHDIFSPPVAAYDQAAITWGYFSRIGSIPDHPPLFCTDEDTQAAGSADCTPYDAGAEPLVYINKSLKRDIATYVRSLFKIADYPQAELDKTAPTTLPPTWGIVKWISLLQRYTSAQVSVLSINGKHGLERRAAAKSILGSFTSSKSWGVPEIYAIADKLRTLALNGTHDEKYWARDVISRLKLGLQNLNSALDAQPAVNNEGGNGTSTDLDFGN